MKSIGQIITPPLSEIENFLLENYEIKPNFDLEGFKSCLYIAQSAIMDKLYDNQEYDNMDIEHRLEMAQKCGEDFRKLIFTYTGIDTFELF